jgi:hypothetical protein
MQSFRHRQMFKQIIMLTLLSLLSIGFSSSALFAKNLHSLEQLAQALRDPALSSYKQQLSKSVAILNSGLSSGLSVEKNLTNHADALVQLIAAWQVDKQLTALQKEFLLYEATVKVRELPRQLNELSHSQLRTSLTQLSNHPTKHFIALPDGGHKIETPAFNIAASAKASLLHLDVLEQTEMLMTTAEQSVDDFVTTISQPLASTQTNEQTSKALQIAALKVLQALPEARLLEVNQQVNDRKLTLPLQTHAFLAKQTGQLASYQRFADTALATGNYSRLGAELAELNLPTLEQISFLTALTSNRQLASNAIYQLGSFIDSHQTVREQLFELLISSKDFVGGAAANAIAKGQDPQIVNQLGQLIQSDADTGQQLPKRRALLALYLNGSDLAHNYLAQFASNPNNQTQQADLVKVVNQWLN